MLGSQALPSRTATTAIAASLPSHAAAEACYSDLPQQHKPAASAKQAFVTAGGLSVHDLLAVQAFINETLSSQTGAQVNFATHCCANLLKLVMSMTIPACFTASRLSAGPAACRTAFRKPACPALRTRTEAYAVHSFIAPVHGICSASSRLCKARSMS